MKGWRWDPKAFDAQGLAAFDCSAEAAAIHEAGHCVMYATLGYKLARCLIEERHISGRSQWLGVTKPVDAVLWSTSPWSSPYDDLDNAAIVVSGVAAEKLFDKDYRHGSSLDELVLFQVLCSNSANKLGLSPPRMSMWLHDNASLILKHNSRAHHDICRALLHEKTLDAGQLAKLCASIEPMGKDVWKSALPR